MSKDTLSDEMKQIVGKPQFKQSVLYNYNPKAHSFFFYTPVGSGREIYPIGLFSPIQTEDIPYEPQELVELIADFMSRSGDDTFDFEFDE